MEIFATIVMLAWIPAVLLLFAVLPPRRAVIIAFLAAWLFLPMVAYQLPFLPDYTKMSATCAGVFLGAMLFDGKRILSFVPRWVDLPIIVFCVCPFASSMVNGLGIWDGVSGVLSNTVTWGMPYFVGRIYFNSAQALRELAISIFIGGLLYVPLCLFELRMSPVLHGMVYGFSPRGAQMRFGGWRPNVFMDGGLPVGLWMTGASLVGFWLWRTGALKKLLGLSLDWMVCPLMITTVLCRSSGALVLLIMAVAVLWFTAVTRSRIALACLIAAAPVYVVLRTSGIWHGEELVAAARLVDKDRAGSLKFRLDNEDILVAKGLQRPIFGWGGWGRGRVYDEWGGDVSVTDGRWVIELGAHGLVGVISLFGALILPLTLLVRRRSPRSLLSPALAPALVLGILVVLYAIDSLPNAMANPIYMLAGGAVTALAVSRNALRAPTQHGESGAPGPMPDAIPLRRLHPGSV